MRRSLFVMLTFGAVLSGCTSSGDDDDGTPRTVFGGDRPVPLQIPAAYDAEQAWPLVMVLHGYGVTAAIQTGYLGTGALVDGEGVLMLAPEGTTDSYDEQFWNATDACCNFDASTVDDVAYLRSLIEDVSEDYTIDSSRVFVIGHSNGGFMAHRMACEASDVVTAVVSIAGMTWLDAGNCTPANDVSVLQIHGDIDDTIFYAGGTVDPAMPSYPSAVETVTHWQVYDACTAGLTLDPARRDLDFSVAGEETKVERFACGGTKGVELWTLEGVSHIPNFSDFPGAVWPWLDAHARP
jgi:polyhydroxybutyrate depolymerase